MRPRRQNQAGGSLDSLLDTMTNVVGILIIVLVITQIKMADAVRRVQSSLPEISEQQLADLQNRFADLDRNDPDIEKERAELEARLKQAEEEARKARERIPQIQAELKQLEQEREKANQADTLKKQLADQEKQKDEREARARKIREEMQQLMLQLKKTPRKKDVPARVVRLPDPQTPPAGAQPRYFICRYGRIYYVDEPALRDALEKVLLRGRGNLEYKNPKTRQPVDRKTIYYDWEKVKTYFDRFKSGTRDFSFKPQISGDKWNRAVYYTLEPSPFSGETLSRLDATASQFRNELNRSLSKKKVYVLFLVYPESFDVYLKAREILEEYKIPGGWKVMSSTPKWFWSPNRYYRKETHGKTRPPPTTPPPPHKPDLLID